ncbi:MAG: hypothetical protein BM555_06155 [Crocinitomix sp. MedPE-SWsnd]|nr:MAG: hypothetical protein BM555_06155 [Crocinitomix sp. MedPE-SWsnd]
MKGWKKMAFLLPVFIIGAVLLTGFIVMTLWNGIMPEVFGLGILSIWQAIGLFILARFLFGRSKGFGRRRRRHHYAYCKVQSDEGSEQSTKDFDPVQ